MSTSDIVQIGNKLRNATQLLQEFVDSMKGVNDDWVPAVISRIYQLIEQWEKEWQLNVVEKELDLGSATSYDGSVFNPQDIPVAKITLCVVTDMEMFLKEIQEILKKDTTDKEIGSPIINKMVCVLATFQFIHHSWSDEVKTKLEDNGFPCMKLNTLAQSITKDVPNFDKIMETIGM